MMGESRDKKTQVSNFGFISKIRASISRSYSVKAIEFYDENDELFHSVGEVSDYSTEWKFSERKQLIGVYGRESNIINQIGFISLDTECLVTGVQSVFEDNVEEDIEPVVEEEIEPELIEITEGNFKCKIRKDA